MFGINGMLSILLLLLLSSSSVFGNWLDVHYPNRKPLTYKGYDKHWIASTKQQLPPCDPMKFKAQAYQESLFDPTCVSKAGAVGLCQFMPSTWRWGKTKLHFRGTPYNPRSAVDAQLKYMRYLCRLLWRNFHVHSEKDLFELALACYNAGYGNVRKAIYMAKSTKWAIVRLYLSKVTGRRSKETVTYVKRIWLHYKRLKDQNEVKRIYRGSTYIGYYTPSERSCRRVSYQEVLQSIRAKGEDDSTIRCQSDSYSRRVKQG